MIKLVGLTMSSYRISQWILYKSYKKGIFTIIIFFGAVNYFYKNMKDVCPSIGRNLPSDTEPTVSTPAIE